MPSSAIMFVTAVATGLATWLICWASFMERDRLRRKERGALIILLEFHRDDFDPDGYNPYLPAFALEDYDRLLERLRNGVY